MNEIFSKRTISAVTLFIYYMRTRRSVKARRQFLIKLLLQGIEMKRGYYVSSPVCSSGLGFGSPAGILYSAFLE
jgi:hypothetical protein